MKVVSVGDRPADGIFSLCRESPALSNLPHTMKPAETSRGTAPAQPRRGLGRPRRRRVLGAMLGATLLAVLYGVPRTAAQAPAEQAAEAEQGPIWGAAEALLEADEDDWLAALSELRTDPARARADILRLLDREAEPHPRRWRLIHHLLAFGREQDIPRLLALLGGETTPLERRIIAGTVRGLYGPLRETPPPPVLINDLTFLQSRPPVPHEPALAGKFVLRPQVFAAYHEHGLNPRLITKMERFRGRRYDTLRDVADAVRPSFGRREWNENWRELLAPVSATPARVVLEGVLRLDIFNPNERPLLLEAEFDAWYGRFETQPATQLLYVLPGQSASRDFRVQLIGQAERPPVRVDLRLRESGGRRFHLNQHIAINY